MNDLDFLLDIKDYIEDREQTIEQEFGPGRPLAEIIAADDMPDVYAMVLARIREVESKKDF